MINSGVDLMAKAAVKILGRAEDTQRMPVLVGADPGNAEESGESGAWSVEELTASKLE
jgi:hypothetical protein